MKLRLGNPRVMKIWTSYWNPISGLFVLLLLITWCAVIVRQEASLHVSPFNVWFWVSLVLAPFQLLGRWRLVVNFDSGDVVSTSGFWPFVRTRTRKVDQIGVVLLDSKESREYRLWLVTHDDEKIAAGRSPRWKSLVRRGRLMAELGKWRFEDASNGIGAAIRFVKKPKRTA